MRPPKLIILLGLALSLVACGGQELSVSLPDREAATLELVFPPGEAVEHRLPFRIAGGVPPYDLRIEGCPDWVRLFPVQRLLAGTGPTLDQGRTFFCTFAVTDSTTPDPVTTSHVLRLVIGSVAPLVVPSVADQSFTVGTFASVPFPAASGGVQPYNYSFTCAAGQLPSGMGFAPETRVFAGTPNTTSHDSCTYTVTDSSQPPQTVSHAVEVQVTGGIALPQDVVSDNKISAQVGQRIRIEFAEATGGVRPYSYELLDCEVEGLTFSHDNRVLSGAAIDTYRGPHCTYKVTDTANPPATASRSVELTVDPLDQGTWRFRTRSRAPSDHPLVRETGRLQTFTTLPLALGGSGTEIYKVVNLRAPLEFDGSPRHLSYRHTGVDPLFNTPTTYRYEVSSEDDGPVHDALCVDISYQDLKELDNLLDTVTVEIREDAFWNGTGYECPDASPSSNSISGTTASNPVHSALAPVHARHAVNVAHAAVWDRVRGWSPGASRKLFAFSPSIGFASLSGLSEGFDYSGASESVSAGAELGEGSWQAGLVASFTRTDLRYRADPSLLGLGYRAGEHDTEVVSVHPFAAWHAPSGGHLWASLGAGMGNLHHRDDEGFPSWSRSDVRLRAYAAGASVPVAEVLSGELDAEAAVEAFAFEIEGGDRISTSLPTLRGRDYRAGLAWSAPIRGKPSVSLAYKHLTGDGPEGGLVEARGSVSVAEFLDPRLTLTGSAAGSFGLGDHEQDSWSLGGRIRFASDGSGDGLELVVDSRLMSLAEGGRPGIAVRGEAGYRMWGGRAVGMVRPYLGLIRYPVDASLRRTLGLDLFDTPTSKVTFEFYDHPRALSRALGLTFTLRRRF